LLAAKFAVMLLTTCVGVEELSSEEGKTTSPTTTLPAAMERTASRDMFTVASRARAC
jgi:hypothetical protein